MAFFDPFITCIKSSNIVISAPIDQYLCDFIQIPPAVFLNHIPFKRYIQTGIYRLVPFLSKFFFNAISVGRIDPIKGIS